LSFSARRSSLRTIFAAEFPILAVEAPLGLPWWLPVVALALIGALSAGLRHLALRKGRQLWKGLAALRRLPVGPSVGAAAAGVLMTATRTLGGLRFAGWAGADRLWSSVAGPACGVLAPGPLHFRWGRRGPDPRQTARR
jgi:hypothetical protein